MSFQQMNLNGEWESEQLPVYRGGSLASRTAVQESVKRLLMNVTSGQKCGELFAKLGPGGLWLKMYGDYCQARMDGSLEEYSGICPTWGLMLDGALILPHGLEPSIDESAFSLLPTPRKFMANGSLHKNPETIAKRHPWNIEDELGGVPNPEYVEWLMGFPQDWTLPGTRPSETP